MWGRASISFDCQHESGTVGRVVPTPVSRALALKSNGIYQSHVPDPSTGVSVMSNLRVIFHTHAHTFKFHRWLFIFFYFFVHAFVGGWVCVFDSLEEMLGLKKSATYII